MPSAAVLGLQAARASPDLTRYLAACAAVVVALLALGWVLRRFVAGRLRVRAARRSLQVLDVLPLAGKQKLVVVRCYDRSFLLGVGEKEVRAIAELDPAAEPRQPDTAPPLEAVPAFSVALKKELETEHELVPRPAPARAPAPGDLKGGILA